MDIFTLTPWNETSYSEALALQRQWTLEGRRGWLLFCCPPTITLGRRGHFSDVLMPMDELKRLGVTLMPVDRGGLVTYHGPGQVIGFPLGTLEDHTGDRRGARAFVQGLQKRLEAFVVASGSRVMTVEETAGNAGVWVHDAQDARIRRKIASIGLSFHRDGIGHGFSFNVQPMQQGFELVNACGEIGARVASVFSERRPMAEFEAVVELLSVGLRS